MKDGHVDPRREGNFGGPLRRERGRSHQAHANKLREGDPICIRTAKAAQTTVVASQAVAAASASGIATDESGTAAVRSVAAALALMETAYYHVEAVHAQHVVVTAQIEQSFSDNGPQPTAEELTSAE